MWFQKISLPIHGRSMKFQGGGVVRSGRLLAKNLPWQGGGGGGENEYFQ